MCIKILCFIQEKIVILPRTFSMRLKKAGKLTWKDLRYSAMKFLEKGSSELFTEDAIAIRMNKSLMWR